MTTPSWIKHLAPGADILIVHHWDTDGNCSAAMIREFLYEKGEFNVSYTSADAGTFRLRFRSDDKEG